MGGSFRARGRARAIFSVIALYALLLQGFLVAMTPASASFGPGAAPICAQDTGDGSNHGPAIGHDSHGCCTAACSASPVPVPELAHHVLAWPLREASPAFWRACLPALSTGPPVHAASARGPPSA
ncbi:hypothetical protein [uncultured Enterovirga sp.]|uniref:hypothetical protein n=1 Tax=uncultured Enterovirga sp. TaxID=2026352 RepID=UPI0035C94D10